MSITKQCTKCGEVKTLDAFYADKRRKDGKRAGCKVCTRKYRQENKERIKEKSRKYYEKNRWEIGEYQRKYRQENKELVAERVRKHRQKNPEVHRRSSRKRRALKRNLPHQPLTPQQYEILHRQKYEIFGGNASGN